MRRLADALLVAAFDLGDSLRSRKVLALFVLYVAGAMATAAGFLAMLKELEGTLAEQLQVASTDRPGALSEALMQSEQLHEILGELTGDPSLVDALVQIPLLALIYAWAALTFVPALVTFTSCDAVASEVASGSCRFALARTDRLSWALGKLLGQGALLGAGILGGALGVWVVGAFGMDGFPYLDAGLWLGRLGVRAWWNGLPYLGLAIAASLMVRTANGARALALFGLVAVGVLDSALVSDDVRALGPVAVDTLRQLMPGAHTLTLWQPLLLDRLPALAMQLALTGAFFSVGFAVFQRRDA